VQVECGVCCMGVLGNMVDTHGVERRGKALNNVFIVPFFQQQFCQVRTIVPVNAGDESDVRHIYFLYTCQSIEVSTRSHSPHAGLPRQILFAGSDLHTLLRAPTTVPSPTETPGATNTSVASQHFSPITTGEAVISKCG